VLETGLVCNCSYILHLLALCTGPDEQNQEMSRESKYQSGGATILFLGANVCILAVIDMYWMPVLVLVSLFVCSLVTSTFFPKQERFGSRFAKGILVTFISAFIIALLSLVLMYCWEIVLFRVLLLLLCFVCVYVLIYNFNLSESGYAQAWLINTITMTFCFQIMAFTVDVYWSYPLLYISLCPCFFICLVVIHALKSHGFPTFLCILALLAIFWLLLVVYFIMMFGGYWKTASLYNIITLAVMIYISIMKETDEWIELAKIMIYLPLIAPLCYFAFQATLAAYFY
jgi:hypothetical protein